MQYAYLNLLFNPKGHGMYILINSVTSYFILVKLTRIKYSPNKFIHFQFGIIHLNITSVHKFVTASSLFPVDLHISFLRKTITVPVIPVLFTKEQQGK